MAVEKYTIQGREMSVVIGGRVTGTRIRDVKQVGLRIYENGCIGVAGAEGNVNESELEKKARKALEYKIKYTAEPSKNKKESISKIDNNFEEEKFVQDAKELVSDLADKHSDVIFGNRIDLIQKKIMLQNDENLELSYEDRYCLMDMHFRFKSSTNIIDGTISYKNRGFNKNELKNYTNNLFNAYKNEIPLTKKRYPVIFCTLNDLCLNYGFINTNFTADLHGQYFAHNNSLLSGKIGQKVFNDNFTLYQTRNPEEYIGPFFDGEGVVNDNNRYTFIENGRLLSPYTDKMTAGKFNLPLTGSAQGQYNEVPGVGPIDGAGIPIIKPAGMRIKSSGKSIKDLLGGEQGIFVVFALGGHYAVDGNYVTPIQLGLFYDGEQFTGRVPAVFASSNVLKMYGQDFRGIAENNLLPTSEHKYMVVDMDISQA